RSDRGPLWAAAVPATISAAAAHPRRARPCRIAPKSHPCRTRAGIDIRFTPKKPLRASIAERDGRRTFQISPEPIRNDFNEGDLVFGDRQDSPVVLPHVVAHLYAVDQPFAVLHEAEPSAALLERPDHAQRVEREALEELARTVRIRALDRIRVVAEPLRGLIRHERAAPVA